jgi:mannitol-1-phosphate/altronate dehydrogenase
VDSEVAVHKGYLCELALWERRWADADRAVTDGLARARSRHMAQLRVWLCARGLRAQAELAVLSRALAFIANREVFGDLIDNDRFVAVYRSVLNSLHTKGARTTLETLV